MLLEFCLVLILTPFNDVFVGQSEHRLPADLVVSGQSEWTYWSHCAVSRDGSVVAVIDPVRREVRALRLDQESPQLVAAHTEMATQASFRTTQEIETFDADKRLVTISGTGVRPDQVNLPIAVAWDDRNLLYVSDNGNRRVSVFDVRGVYQRSFLLPEAVDAPWDIQRYAADTLLLSSVRLDHPREINAGYHCNLVTQDGELVRSFAYTPDSAFSRNLWTGLYGHCVIDTRGATYVNFSSEPVISVYNHAGELERTFGDRPLWWVSPPVLPDPMSWSSQPELRARCKWTRVVRLVLFGTNKLLRVTECNGLVPTCKQRFILDVFSTDGRLLAGNITSDYWPVGVADDGAVFFLSVAGDHLLTTRFRLKE